jgi:hypothetical protein
MQFRETEKQEKSKVKIFRGQVLWYTSIITATQEEGIRKGYFKERSDKC